MSILDNIENVEHILGDLEAFRYGDKVFMTGQEWLARFKKELPPPTTSGRLIEWVKRDDVVAAAKHVAGL